MVAARFRFFLVCLNRLGCCSSLLRFLLFHKLASYFLDTIRTIGDRISMCCTSMNTIRLVPILIHESIKRWICAINLPNARRTADIKNYEMQFDRCIRFRLIDRMTLFIFIFIRYVQCVHCFCSVKTVTFGGDDSLKIETCSRCVSCFVRF